MQELELIGGKKERMCHHEKSKADTGEGRRRAGEPFGTATCKRCVKSAISAVDCQPNQHTFSGSKLGLTHLNQL